MNAPTQTILEAALALPPDERADLADKLWISLDFLDCLPGLPTKRSRDLLLFLSFLLLLKLPIAECD